MYFVDHNCQIVQGRLDIQVAGLHARFRAGGKLSFLKSWGGGGGNTIQECIGVQRLGGWVGWTYYIVGNNAMYNSRGLRDW